MRPGDRVRCLDDDSVGTVIFVDYLSDDVCFVDVEEDSGARYTCFPEELRWEDPCE